MNGCSDRGETTTQVVIVVPVVIVILMIAVQASVYFHTSNVAGAAASQGAAAAAVHGATSVSAVDRGRSAAMEIVGEAGSRLFGTPAVALTTTTVTVTVAVVVPKIVPFFPGTVQREATEPRERFTTEAAR